MTQEYARNEVSRIPEPQKYKDVPVSTARKFTPQHEGKVRVIHGSNEGYYDIAGQTVGFVRKKLREVFNLPVDVEAKVNEEKVGDDFILTSNMNLEFFKDAGVKGRFFFVT